MKVKHKQATCPVCGITKPEINMAGLGIPHEGGYKWDFSVTYCGKMRCYNELLARRTEKLNKLKRVLNRDEMPVDSGSTDGQDAAQV